MAKYNRYRRDRPNIERSPSHDDLIDAIFDPLIENGISCDREQFKKLLSINNLIVVAVRSRSEVPDSSHPDPVIAIFTETSGYFRGEEYSISARDQNISFYDLLIEMNPEIQKVFLECPPINIELIR